MAPYVTQWRLRALERDGRLPVEPDKPDQRPHLRLGRAQPHRPARRAQPLREHGDVDHQRRIGEAQLGEVDADVVLRVDRSGQRLPPQRARRPVLIPCDEQDGLL